MRRDSFGCYKLKISSRKINKNIMYNIFESQYMKEKKMDFSLQSELGFLKY